MKFALGRYHNNGITFSSLDDSGTVNLSEVKGLIVSALDCHIHVIPTKLNTDQQIRSFCEHYIKTIHPGPYSNLEMDYLLAGKGKKRTIILVIIEKEILEVYLSQGLPLYFLFQLDFMGTPGTSLSCRAGDFFAHYIFEDQSLQKVEISSIRKEGTLKLPRSGITYKMNRKRNKRLFHENNSLPLSSVIPPILLSLILLTLCYQGAFSLYEYKQQKSINQQKQKIIQERAAQRYQPEEQSADQEEILRWGDVIYSSKPTDYYSLLSLIASNLRNRVSIKSLKITGKTMTINGTTASALQLIEDLKETGAFSELTPSRIYPREDGKEEFSLTGVFHEDFR